MKKLFYFVGEGMAGFQDWGVGLAIAALVLAIFQEMDQGIVFLLLFISFEGFFFGLFPDFDLYLPMRLRVLIGSDEIAHHHESVMHWPFVMLLAVAILGILAEIIFGKWGAIVGITAYLSVLAHYIHDGMMMGKDGWGWFFRTDRAHWTRLGRIEPADPNHDHWIEENWLKMSPLSVREISIGSIALGITVAILTGMILNGLVLMWVVWMATFLVWVTYSRVKWRY